MSAARPYRAYILAFIAGTILWFLAVQAGGKREAWDAAVYWTVAYPIAIGVSGGLGYLFPERPWRWALTLFMAQFATMAIRNSGSGGFWPMGMVLLAALSVPGMIAGRFASRLRCRISGKTI